jgi:nitrite reductase/ring-hydroxylating ferredoxin subunit
MAAIVGNVEDIPVGKVVSFEVDGESIAIANVEGALFAFADLCSHRGCSLAEGTLEGSTITCPCHFSQFKVTDGSVVNGPATRPQDTYGIEVVEGKVAVSGRQAGPSDSTQGEPTPPAVPPSQHQTSLSPATPLRSTGTTADQSQVHNALAAVPLFADLDPASIERLEAFSFRRTFAPGEVIVEEGHTGNGLYVVLSGTVDVIVGLKSDHPRRVAVLHEGEPFGEMALLGDWKRSASVQAEDAVECLGLDRWAFLAHLKNEPNLAIRMLQMMANRLMETNQRLGE